MLQKSASRLGSSTSVPTQYCTLFMPQVNSMTTGLPGSCSSPLWMSNASLNGAIGTRIEDWCKVLWSDESPFTLRYKGSQRVWRGANQRYNPRNCVETVKHDVKINVWGCFFTQFLGLYRWFAPLQTLWLPLQRSVNCDSSDHRTLRQSSGFGMKTGWEWVVEKLGAVVEGGSLPNDRKRHVT